MIVRTSLSCSGSQYSKGEFPGTLVSSPRILLGEEKKAVAGAKVADKTAMTAENFIVEGIGRRNLSYRDEE